MPNTWNKLWKIPVKDWKHLKQAIFSILHGCSVELRNRNEEMNQSRRKLGVAPVITGAASARL